MFQVLVIKCCVTKSFLLNGQKRDTFPFHTPLKHTVHSPIPEFGEANLQSHVRTDRVRFPKLNPTAIAESRALWPLCAQLLTHPRRAGLPLPTVFLPLEANKEKFSILTWVQGKLTAEGKGGVPSSASSWKEVVWRAGQHRKHSKGWGNSYFTTLSSTWGFTIIPFPFIFVLLSVFRNGWHKQSWHDM